MALPVSRLQSISDRMITEYGAADRMRIGRVNKFHMALPEIKLGLLQWLPESWHVSI
jgi:hypothetical protein